VHLPDILEWRFGTNGRPAQAANYGIGTRIENLWFRLWLRAELWTVVRFYGYVCASEVGGPGPLAVASDSPSLFKREKYRPRSLEVAGWNAFGGGQEAAKRIAGGDDPEGVRMLAKRLRRLRANIVFEYLSQEQADGLVFRT